MINNIQFNSKMNPYLQLFSQAQANYEMVNAEAAKPKTKREKYWHTIRRKKKEDL